VIRGVIGEVQCDFFQIFAPTPYSAVSLLYAPALAPIKIGFSAVQCGLVWSCGLCWTHLGQIGPAQMSILI
jgi:hypothetical protein